MWQRFRLWREDRKLAKLQIPETQWKEAIGDWGVYTRYSLQDQARLRELALRLLLRKAFAAGGDFVITDTVRLRIATMASVLVLGLGLEWYRRWESLIVYQNAFIPTRDQMDEFGIVHTGRRLLSGEAWQQGLVILSWEDVCHAGQGGSHNVVLHEMAHQLDMLHDGANGAPPIHRGMNGQQWHDVFAQAWHSLKQLESHQHSLPIDPYALESPAEFFAVMTELFFETPDHLQTHWPALYQQLQAFYRQDPVRGQVER